jgi:hypothetical protein
MVPARLHHIGLQRGLRCDQRVVRAVVAYPTRATHLPKSGRWCTILGTQTLMRRVRGGQRCCMRCANARHMIRLRIQGALHACYRCSPRPCACLQGVCVGSARAIWHEPVISCRERLSGQKTCQSSITRAIGRENWRTHRGGITMSQYCRQSGAATLRRHHLSTCTKCPL